MVAGKTDQRGSDGAMPVRAQRPQTRAMAEGVGRGEHPWALLCVGSILQHNCTDIKHTTD